MAGSVWGSGARQSPKGPFREAFERKGHATPLFFRSISTRLLAVGLFVSFGEFEKHDFLALVVDIEQHSVRAYSQPILSGEL